MKSQRLLILLDGDTGKVTVGGDVDALDLCVFMLERAKLEIDARYRFERARSLVVESAQNQDMLNLASNPSKLRA